MLWSIVIFFLRIFGSVFMSFKILLLFCKAKQMVYGIELLFYFKYCLCYFAYTSVKVFGLMKIQLDYKNFNFNKFCLLLTFYLNGSTKVCIFLFCLNCFLYYLYNKCQWRPICLLLDLIIIGKDFLFS